MFVQPCLFSPRGGVSPEVMGLQLEPGMKQRFLHLTPFH